MYVVTEPESVRGAYESWAECQAAISGVSGVRYQTVKDQAEAQAILNGVGVVLEPGLYAFTDGNKVGGIGVVIVRVDDKEEGEPRVIQDIAGSVREVFQDAEIPGLETEQAIENALGRFTNILAELGALYMAIAALPEKSNAIIVHDYKGVGAFMDGRWSPENPIVKAVISASEALVSSKNLGLRFIHQRGHMSTWAGRHDLAWFNARADALASQGGELDG